MLASERLRQEFNGPKALVNAGGAGYPEKELITQSPLGLICIVCPYK